MIFLTRVSERNFNPSRYTGNINPTFAIVIHPDCNAQYRWYCASHATCIMFIPNNNDITTCALLHWTCIMSIPAIMHIR